jgi:dUTP pyrophosphatase
MILVNVMDLDVDSLKKVLVECDYNVSHRCRKKIRVSYVRILDNMSHNGRFMCNMCNTYISYIKLLFTSKVIDDNIDRHFDFDTESYNYLAGYLSLCVRYDGNNLIIPLSEIENNPKVVNILANLVEMCYINMSVLVTDSISLLVHYCNFRNKYLDMFSIVGNNIDSIPSIMCPNIENNNLMTAFMRGYFDKNGILDYTNEISCKLLLGNNIVNGFREKINVMGNVEGDYLVYRKNNAFDMLAILYEDAVYYLDINMYCYRYYCNYVTYSSSESVLSFKYALTDSNAVVPSKGHISDSGYDLTVIKEIKRVGNVVYYDTCVKVEPDYGWYFDVVPRSSLSKSGYMLANSVGIIDRTYTGSIIVALMKVDHSMSDIELPYRCVQMIPRQIVHMKMIKVDESDIGVTSRASGGFGSTNV